MDDSPAIEVKKLTKVFGSKRALHNVSFSVPKGAIFGFLGPNGAGKTTAIRCMMDFIRPTSGTITIFGKDSHKDSAELKKHIGFLPSDLQLDPNWTVGDHLKLVKSVRGSNSGVSALIKQFELQRRSKVKQLSTGNKQKLSILLALAGQPKLLIMDEPSRGLDPVLQNTLYDLLRDFVARGNTIFFSSHNLSEVQRMCDAVVLIKDGKVVTEQGMDEIRGANIHIISATTQKVMLKSELTELGAEVQSFDKFHVTLKIAGEVGRVVSYLGSHKLSDLTVSHASLEDIFLAKYKEKR